MIQHHVLWNMDGRMWVETMPDIGPDTVRMASFNHAIERGWATIIPAHLMVDFVRRVEDYDKHVDDQPLPLSEYARMRSDVGCRVCGNPTGACEVPGACL